MSTTGYSKKPLFEKLGFVSGDTILVKDPPGWYEVSAMQHNLHFRTEVPAMHAHAFCQRIVDLEMFLNSYEYSQVEKSIWFSWPKKASGVATDITEQTFRDYLLPLGWVDTKVCAIDDTWSGLKFLRRKV